MTKIDSHVRWVVRRDVPAILEIDRIFEDPMSEEELMVFLRDKNIQVFVIEVGDMVAGYMIFAKMSRKLYELISVAVRPEFQRRGLATKLVERIKARLPVRGRIIAVVNEYHLTAQLFLRALGFRWKSTKNYQGVDSYLMSYEEHK